MMTMIKAINPSSMVNTAMLNYSIKPHRSGEDAERAILEWLAQSGCPTPGAVYIWPGTIPDQDLRDMALALPDWEYDSVIIYYQVWDPMIPEVVPAFNTAQDRYMARWWRRSDSGAPEHLIAVIPAHRYRTAHLADFLVRPGNRTWDENHTHPGGQ